jgi:hypothetical protein
LTTMTTAAYDPRCILCQAGPETAALLATGPVLTCIDTDACDDRAAQRTDAILAAIGAGQ